MKYAVDLALDIGKVSRPARGAWIEILRALLALRQAHVAPREGRVD